MNVWRSAAGIQGLLLMGGLEAPSLGGMGGPAMPESRSYGAEEQREERP